MEKIMSVPVPESRNRRIVLWYFLFSMGFGLLMGLVFPVFASLFVEYRSPGHQTVFTVACVFAGVVVGLFSFLIGRLTVLRIIEQISRRLAQACEQAGELGQDIELVSSDCIGRLVRNFNKLQAKLRTVITDLKQVTENSEKLGFDLAANSTQTASATEQITRHMESIHGNSELLLEEVSHVDTARQQINTSASLVADNINRQSDSLTRLSALIEQVLEQFKSLASETNHKTQAIFSSITLSSHSLEDIIQVAHKIKEIEASAGRIGELVGAINDTAERINVLGINASIEASHAGETGKGFAVVANEIRKLSDLARQNSRHITERLQEVMSQVNEGVELSVATESNLTTLFGGINHSAQDIRQVSERLDGFVVHTDSMIGAHNDLVKATIDVTNSMVKMRSHTDVIENSMINLLDTAVHNQSAIEEITIGIREIATDVAQLNAVSSSNSANIHQLKGVIERFRTGSS